MNNPVRRSGFTLIEVLVAVAVSGIVLAAAYGLLFAAQRGSERVGQVLEKNLETRRTMDLLKREFEALFLEDDPDPEEVRTFFRVSNRERFGHREAWLAFTTLDPGKGVVRRYEYRLVAGTLVKRGGELRDDAPVVEVPIIDGVDSFGVEVLNDETWLPAWDTGIEHRAPDAVRVELLPRGAEKPIVVTARPRRDTRL